VRPNPRGPDVSQEDARRCGREAGFITGQRLHVDGGASLMDAFAPLELQGILEGKFPSC
jgi:hypothetical protein